MSEYGMNGEELAPIVTNPPQAQKVTRQKWTMRDVDALAGGRGNFILVKVANPKLSGSDAHMMYPYQGKINQPSVTVAEYLKVGSELKGRRGPLGLARVRSDLTYNLEHGFVEIVTVK